MSPETDALFLDFDGTLTEIVPHPADAVLTPARRAALARIPGRFGGAAAILSGRTLTDLNSRVPDTFWRVGGHGDEIAAPGWTTVNGKTPGPHPRLIEAAETAARCFPGVIYEVKSNGVALHYRAAPEAGPDCIALLEAVLNDAPGYVLQHGKMVVEVKPERADKGRALRCLMLTPPFAGRRPVMIGDDITDEAAMHAALALGGVAIKVGPGDSVAGMRLENPEAVYACLSASG